MVKDHDTLLIKAQLKRHTNKTRNFRGYWYARENCTNLLSNLVTARSCGQYSYSGDYGFKSWTEETDNPEVYCRFSSSPGKRRDSLQSGRDHFLPHPSIKLSFNCRLYTNTLSKCSDVTKYKDFKNRTVIYLVTRVFWAWFVSQRI